MDRRQQEALNNVFTKHIHAARLMKDDPTNERFEAFATITNRHVEIYMANHEPETLITAEDIKNNLHHIS